MKTKQEVIKEAWGENWVKLRNRGKEQAVTDNGYVNVNYIMDFYSIVDLMESDVYPDDDFFRPKSLQGIDNNNGWIPLFGKEKEVPIEQSNIELYSIETKEHYVSKDTHEFIEVGRFTHWKPIILSKPPLY